MTRLWLPVRRWVFLGLATLAMLIVLLPLRLGAGLVGLDRLGVSAGAMSGLVWSGEVADARAGPLPLGRVHVSLNPLPLLLGEARLRFTGRPRKTAPGETGLSGLVAGSRNSVAVRGLVGSLEAGALGTGLPVGAVTFTDFAARWDAGRCVEAAGRVRADLTGPVAGLPLGSLSGTPRCAGDALLLPLESGSGRERLDLRIAPGGTTASFLVTGADPSLVPALAGAGFRPDAEGYRRALPLGGGA